MEKLYDDEMLPDDFAQIAKAYSNSLKDKGFVFVRLEEEEFNLLVSEILVLLAKMKACLKKLNRKLKSNLLQNRISKAEESLCQKFENKNPHKFVCVENENFAFLSLISLENLLTIKLMLLSIKSGEFELCNSIMTSICSVFAESFSCEGFVVDDKY